MTVKCVYFAMPPSSTFAMTSGYMTLVSCWAQTEPYLKQLIQRGSKKYFDSVFNTVIQYQ